jgi:hypothetical protein
MKRLNVLLLTAVFLCLSLVIAQAGEKETVAGAGPSTKIVKVFMAELAKLPACDGVLFEVPPKSTKHAGGIKCSNYNLFGRTGRPLNAKEQELNKGEIFLAKVPIAFVAGSNTGVSQLTLGELEKIYTRKITNWKDVGGVDAPIVLVGREQTEALFLELKEEYSFYRNVAFDVVLTKDNHIVSFMQSPKGANAIAFGAKPNFSELNIVDVSGFASGVRLGLVYDMSNSDNPIVKEAMALAKTDAWQETVKASGLIPLY